MKCWHEENTDQSISAKIDYAELMFKKFKNTFQSMFLI
jgi:hypothetical protein